MVALAELVMVLHFGVLVFLVVGGFLAWRWHRVLYPHLVMAGWALLIVLFPVSCPLTWLENVFREAGGLPPLAAGGFIDTYIDGVLYPESAAGVVQLFVGVAVLTSWTGLYLRRRAGQPASAGVVECGGRR
ncbi:DUF2784 domain-containing protein [Actinosynnema sp. NPDC020468]|uniref:DUF2784 domain-containing protein n=1 Tax=Actinosynnema sp. NPDC020468 TaxID=3154488 RepID=UPI00340A515F